MPLEVVVGLPPNYVEIAAAFDLSRPAIFCYGGKIYSPHGAAVDAHLYAHESVHVEQHRLNGGSDRWWQLFIDDPDFRVHQEIQAYRAQFKSYCRVNRDRNSRAFYLSGLASALSSPLYGSAIEYQEAMKSIRS